jgi:hypothetical protein
MTSMPASLRFGRRTRALLVCLVAAVGLTACDSEPVTTGGPTAMRRLTEAQYRNIISDVFGSHIIVAGRFDPLVRTDGLLTVGASRANVTPAGVERYAAMARSIALQVVDEKNRVVLVPCAPASATGADDACAKAFYTKVGRLLYRRALTTDEVDLHARIAATSANTRGDFYAGLSYGLQGLLQAPDFLFITENVNKEVRDGRQELDAYAKATRLSFLLWNSSPDDQLLTAAESGELNTDIGLEKQVDRLMASLRLKGGVRSFFSDMLALDDFATLEKDTVIYPAFSLAAAIDSKEQVLRTIDNKLVAKNTDYRDLFTTRETFMTSALGLVYRVPATVPGGWAPYEFAENDPRAGIQTLLSFVALHSHPGKSSPTLRGKAVRELLLCQKIPDPPGDVDFSGFNDPNSPAKTARDRLTAHSTEPACAGCHKLMDPIGLAMEKFDGAGQFRTSENGAVIDTSGEINGIPFNDAKGLGAALRQDPAATSCVVNRVYSYALGRSIERAEREVVSYLEKSFAADGYKFVDLLRRIATSKALYTVSPQAVRAAGAAVEESKS